MTPEPVPLTDTQRGLLQQIAAEIERLPIPMNKYRNKAGLGRSACFGFVNKRGGYVDLSRNNWMRPYLAFLLEQYGKTLSINWNAITINQNYKTNEHRDKGNEGVSYIVGFGAYQGGALNVRDYGDYDIQTAGLIFNGAESLHSTKDFTGTRYSIVFYVASKSPDKSYWTAPLPRVLTAKNTVFTQGWAVFNEEGKIIDGLPHALCGKKKPKKST